MGYLGHKVDIPDCKALKNGAGGGTALGLIGQVHQSLAVGKLFAISRN